MIIGGPLDGQTYRPKTQWPSYISDEGVALPAADGDRVFGTRENKSKIKSCYIMRRDPAVLYGKGITYVHSSTLPVL